MPKPINPGSQGRGHEVHIFVHVDSTAADGTVKQVLNELVLSVQEIKNQLVEVTRLENQEITTLTELEDKVSALEAKVAAENDVITSAENLLTGINQMLKDALAGGGSAAAVVARVQALSDSVDAKTTELAASVAANTPAAPEPTP